MSNIFSIVMPSFNQAKYISDAINSVLNQSGDFYIDLIIKDGGSTDGAKDIIENFANIIHKYPKERQNNLEFYFDESKEFIKCKGISYRWVSQKDRGFADAINQGISESVGNIFSYLNTDDYLLEKALEIVNNAFTKEPGFDVVYGEGWDVKANGEIINRYGTQDVNKWNLANGNCMPQPSVFIKSTAVKKAGYFSELIRNSIDYEYWLRLQTIGAKFLYVQEYLSATRIYADTKTLKNRKIIIKETLAIQLHYHGDIHKVDPEFVLGMSFIGRYTSLLPKFLWFIRNSMLRLLTMIWLKRNYNELLKYEKEIF